MPTLHVIDAFTDRAFTGNPAAVCVLDEAREDTWMKLVAREMNLSETAFLHPVENGFSLRWFTPAVEVSLCGHATLASAHALWEMGAVPRNETLRFSTKSGWLTAQRSGDLIELDFPAAVPEPCEAPNGLAQALGCDPKQVQCKRNSLDYLVEVADEATLRSLRPDFTVLAALPVRGIIVTCRSESADFDFISRFFAPAAGVNEDPVTGSAHCALGPYWQEKLGKDEFTAYQASERGGIIGVQVCGSRVKLRGQAVSISRVELFH